MSVSTDPSRLQEPTVPMARLLQNGSHETRLLLEKDDYRSIMKTVAPTLVAIALLPLSTVARAAEPTSPPVAPVTKATTDQQTASGTFVRKAAQDSLLEVESGKLALSKSSNADIKAFAQQMITDHGKANVELQKIVGARYQVPARLDADHQAKLELLMTKSGDDFDHAYANAMADGHQQTIKLFDTAASDSALTTDLQQFARQMLPTLQHHHLLSRKLTGNDVH